MIDTLLIYICLFGYASALIYKDCGSKEATLVEVAVSGCPGTAPTPCAFARGTNASISIKFKPSESIEKLRVLVKGKISILPPVPFPMPQPEACQAGLKCPLAPGEPVTFTAIVPVLTSYPSVKAVVSLELQDENSGSDAVCIQFPVVITSSIRRALALRRYFHL